MLFAVGLVTMLAVFVACSGEQSGSTASAQPAASAPAQEKAKPEPVAEPKPADPMQNKGIGPVKSVEIATLDPALAAKGKTLFENNCSACHKVDKRYVGPALQDVTTRRSPEWIMNMMLNPTEMTQKDPIAKELLAEYLSPMAQQIHSQDDARAILEFFRQNDAK